MGQAYTTDGSNKFLGTNCRTDAECITNNGIIATDKAIVCCLKTKLLRFGPTSESIK